MLTNYLYRYGIDIQGKKSPPFQEKQGLDQAAQGGPLLTKFQWRKTTSWTMGKTTNPMGDVALPTTWYDDAIFC